MNQTRLIDPVELRQAYTASGARPDARRHALGPAAVGFGLGAALLLGGAQAERVALLLAAALTLAAAAAVFFGGPRRATPGMLAGAAALAVYAVSGLGGPFGSAAGALATVLGAGAAWSAGRIVAHHTAARSLAWSVFMWTAAGFCLFAFFQDIAAAGAPERVGEGLAGQLGGARVEAALFGLLTLIGSGRVIQVLKSLRAISASRAQTVDGLMRRGLAGLLLTGLAGTCLALTHSRIGLALAVFAVAAYAWIEVSAYTRNRRASPTLMFLRWPLLAAALAAAGAGVWQGFAGGIDDWSAAGAVAPERAPLLAAHVELAARSPWLGQGLGELPALQDALTGPQLAAAAAAYPDAPPLYLAVIIEAGALGLALLLAPIGVMLVDMTRALVTSRRTSRDHVRLALAASGFMALNAAIDQAVGLPATVWVYAFVMGAACGAAKRLTEPTEARSPLSPSSPDER